MTALTPGSTGAQGVAHVVAGLQDPILFGLPGGHTVEVFDALRDLGDDVEAVLVREESIGTVMAESYGRFTGRPAVVMAQGAWILGAGGIGIMEAHLGSSPMVVLLDATEGGSYSHHGPYQSGFGGYGAFDLPAAMAAITKRTFVATDPVQAVQMTQLAVTHATTGEPGPVAVVFHSRALLGRMTDDDVRRVTLAPHVPAPAPCPETRSLDAAAAALDDADRVVVLAGNGARAAQDEVLRLAEHLRAPVVTTPGGKGVVPETHELAFGVIGSFGHDTANRALGAADTVVAVGTKIGATDTMEEHPDLVDGTRQTIVQIDVEPLNLGWTQRVAHPLVGRAQDVLPLLGARAAAGPARLPDWARQVRDTARELPVPELAEGDRVNPRALAALLAELVPDDAVATCDAGENRLFMLHDYRVRPGGTILQPNGGGGMGYAVPAALAATYALPGRLPVAVLGDGGYSMSLHALMSAVENRRHLLVVVMDNQALGWVLHGQGERPFMSTFGDFDLAAIAGSIGCTTTLARTREEITGAVDRAVAEPAVHVVVVPVSLSESFLTLRSPMAGASHEEVGADRSPE
ncbi:thiamine pyrophosphate-binding protein [Kocuria sp. M1R5S2]|uniref:thiamine pyrophosphate-binding protein n=1 Tax=Kocuria rhizosphaerae TaxID=3376285 RepID=UPI0037B179D5